MSRLSANLLLLLAGAIWGMSFVEQKVGMEHVGPFAFIALRFLVASIILLPFAFQESYFSTREKAPFGVKQLLQFCSIGLCLFLGMASQQVGLLTISVTNSGFLTGLYVVFTPLLSIALFKQWPHVVVWPAALLALCGIFLLSGGDFTQLTLGDGLTIFSAVCWAMQVVLIARFVVQSNRPLLLSFVQFALTSVLAFVLVLAFEQLSWDMIMGASRSILFTGIFATGIAFSFQVIAQRHTTAPQAAIFLSSEALFAALFGALRLDERVGLIGLLGCALIFTAMLVVEVVPELLKQRQRSLEQ